jgi:hypothetical protein
MPSLIVFRSSINTIIYPYTYPIRATDNGIPKSRSVVKRADDTKYRDWTDRVKH